MYTINELFVVVVANLVLGAHIVIIPSHVSNIPSIEMIYLLITSWKRWCAEESLGGGYEDMRQEKSFLKESYEGET